MVLSSVVSAYHRESLIVAGQPWFNIAMRELVNQAFQKTHNCPSNDALLLLLDGASSSLLDPASSGKAPVRETEEILAHVSDCEFCALSLELLRSYPADFNPVAPAPPPVPEEILRLFRKDV